MWSAGAASPAPAPPDGPAGARPAYQRSRARNSATAASNNGEAGVGGGDKSAFVQLGAVVGRVGIGDDLAGVVALAQCVSDEFVEVELLGPAISMMPFTGGHDGGCPGPGQVAGDALTRRSGAPAESASSSAAFLKVKECG